MQLPTNTFPYSLLVAEPNQNDLPLIKLGSFIGGVSTTSSSASYEGRVLLTKRLYFNLTFD